MAFLYFILFLSITSRHFSILQDIYQYTRHFILLSFKLHCPVLELFFNLFDTTKNYFVPVWIELKETESHIAFSSFFFFFFFPVHEQCRGQKNIVYTLFTNCSCTVYSVNIHRSHDTIHTFKNYFATVFSVFSFSNNKFNPNELWIYFCYSVSQ